MIDSHNILLITDSEDIANLVEEKLVLLRGNDRISVCHSADAKRTMSDSLYNIILLHELESEEATLKLVNNIKSVKNNSEILLLLNKENKNLVLRAYDVGIFDFLYTNSEDYEYLIKAVNCFKLRVSKEKSSRDEKFLYQLGVIDSKTNLYQYKYLKEIFIDLSDDLRIQHGIFAIITLDKKTKTKVSTNRLAIILKNTLRQDDIIAIARGGKFYAIFPNIDMLGAKSIMTKLQEKMGPEFKIRAGVSKIGIRSFETLDKNAQDSLICATQNDSLYVSLEDKQTVQNSWLEDEDVEPKKAFKLFSVAFSNKLERVITPTFYRFQKDFETKLSNSEVSQYANNVECVFSLKNENVHSELVIHYDGYTKFNIEITHSGLDSAENTKISIPLTKLTDKFLSTLLKQLKDEYKQTAFKKGN
jgi:hypothetical protein